VRHSRRRILVSRPRLWRVWGRQRHRTICTRRVRTFWMRSSARFRRLTSNVERRLLSDLSEIYARYFASLSNQDRMADAFRVIETSARASGSTGSFGSRSHKPSLMKDFKRRKHGEWKDKWSPITQVRTETGTGELVRSEKMKPCLALLRAQIGGQNLVNVT
jgi:hypothetical protein